MIKQQIEEVLKEYIQIDPNWDYGIEQCWKKEIAILTADVPATIAYFLHDCTDEEFFWLSEIFSDLSEKVPSKELVEALRTRLNAIKRENYRPKEFYSELLQKMDSFDEFMDSIEYEVVEAEGVLNYILWKKETEGTEAKE